MSPTDSGPGAASTLGLHTKGPMGVAAFTVGGLIVGTGLGWAAWKAAAAGHGTYVPAIALFPFTMALAILFGPITPPLIGLALAQFPTYAFLLSRAAAPGSRLRLTRRIVAIHLLVAIAAIICAVMKEGYLP